MNKAGETEADSKRLIVVGIGAAAGGRRAFEDFFDHVPQSICAAFVVIPHLSLDFKDLMRELLEKHTDIQMEQVVDSVELRPNCVFLMPPGQSLTIQKNTLYLTTHDQELGHSIHFPINMFFHSLSTAKEDRAIGIILSETGNDGSKGISSIAKQGEIILVQSPEIAEFDGMPLNAIATGIPDCVLSPRDLAWTVNRLIEVPSRRSYLQNIVLKNITLNASHLEQIIALLKHYKNIDFTHYKTGTLERQINRRCALSGSLHLEQYMHQLETSAKEREMLRDALLITDTHFMRDLEAWNYLKAEVLPIIITKAEETRRIRIWVTACATGEEAYSMAILLQELMTEHMPLEKGDQINIKIFATDIDPIALRSASQGLYDADAMKNLTSEQVKKFFIRRDSKFEIARNIRKMVIFTNHNVTKDTAFTKIDLVSCRNMLIYMQPALQNQVIHNLHFSLKKSGVLFLGDSENIGVLEDEFEPVHRKWNIYQKRGRSYLPSISYLSAYRGANQWVKRDTLSTHKATTAGFDPLIETAFAALLENRAATCVLVDRNNQLMHICGDALKLLRIVPGRASQDLIKMMPTSLHLALSTALHRVHLQDQKVHYNVCEITEEGYDIDRVSIEVSKQKSQNIGYFLMVLIEAIETPKAGQDEESFSIDRATEQYVFQLQRELQANQESLQATVEELEVINEEQRATNEELTASNKELQNMNKEIHSVNEELYTAHSRYQSKIQELTELNTINDMLEKQVKERTAELRDSQQIWQSIPNGIYIYDLETCRNLYMNAYIERLLGYSQQEIQKLGSQLTEQLVHPDDLEKVSQYHQEIATSSKADNHVFSSEYRIRDSEGHWHNFYSQDLVFKRDNEGSPTQIIGTVTDISDRKAAALQLQESETRYRQLYQRTPVMMHAIDLSGNILSVSDQWLASLGYREEDVLGQPIASFLSDPFKPDPNDLETPVWLKEQGCDQFHCQFVCKNNNTIDVKLSAVADKNADGSVQRLLTVLIDTTEHNAAKEINCYRDHLEELVASRAHQLKETNQKLKAEVNERIEAQAELNLRAKALERSNADLEQFAYIVSHDLQEPIRAMTVFSQLLQQRHQAKLDDVANNYINNIIEGGIRMQALIDGILEYSRVTHRGRQFQSVELTQLVETVISGLGTTLLLNDASVTVGRLPTIQADASQISQLFQNLISNAVKFKRDEPPSIQITAQAQPSGQSSDGNQSKYWLFSVKDNGIGIETNQQARIFALFQRLHTRQELEGYGIGLAICKKIIERHNGNIWVESIPGEGSTFFFTLGR